MIAYNKSSLDNLLLHDELDAAFQEDLIDKEEVENAKGRYPADLYMPNLFIRIGLFVLTIIIVCFSSGLFSLLFFSAGGKETFAAVSIFVGLVTYGTLEFIVKSRHHFRSGVDDALLWMSAAFIIVGVNGIADLPPIGNSILIFFLALYLSLRFADSLMTLVASLALLATVFFTCVKFGDFAKAAAPFIIMAAAALLYLFARKLSQRVRLHPYKLCLLVAEITTLLCFYLAGNYYVVRETSNAMFHLNLGDGENIPFYGMFWAFTVLVPLVYVIRGIQKKNMVLLRLGLALLVVTMLTIRFYYHVLAPETAMTLAGIMLIGIAYALIKYLKTPKHGFTYIEPIHKTVLDKFQVESLVIAESFGQPQQPATSHVSFGGGSGGGAGASGEF